MSKKVKYIYDPNSAEFIPAESNRKKWIQIGIISCGLSLIFGIFISSYLPIIIHGSSDTYMTNELNEIKHQYEILNDELDKSQKLLSSISERDNHLYRSYFDMDSIPQDIRQGGFGGSDKYSKFETMSFGNLIASTSKRVDMLKSQLAIQNNSLIEVTNIAKKKDQAAMSIPAIQPISNNDLMRLSSGFGMRIHPILKIPKLHAGIDFKAEIGTPIYATANGVIEKAGIEGGYGNTVIINHGNGYQTLYAHMSKLNTQMGAKVNRGQVIGYVGNSGLSSGPHLHYEVHKNGEKIDPISYFYQDLNASQYSQLQKKSQEMSVSFD